MNRCTQDLVPDKTGEKLQKWSSYPFTCQLLPYLTYGKPSVCLKANPSYTTDSSMYGPKRVIFNKHTSRGPTLQNDSINILVEQSNQFTENRLTQTQPYSSHFNFLLQRHEQQRAQAILKWIKVKNSWPTTLTLSIAQAQGKRLPYWRLYLEHFHDETVVLKSLDFV